MCVVSCRVVSCRVVSCRVVSCRVVSFTPPPCLAEIKSTRPPRVPPRAQSTTCSSCSPLRPPSYAPSPPSTHSVQPELRTPVLTTLPHRVPAEQAKLFQPRRAHHPNVRAVPRRGGLSPQRVRATRAQCRVCACVVSCVSFFMVAGA
jgi:hypothetical protein